MLDLPPQKHVPYHETFTFSVNEGELPEENEGLAKKGSP